MKLLFWLLIAASANAANTDTAPLPPKVIYHVGQKKHLLEDDRLGTIPEDVWNNSIMGRQTNFGLVPYRRGLYGGKNFDSLELYGNLYLGSRNGTPKIPWVMKIIIKDECLKPEAVTDTATNEKFLGWIFSNADYLVKNAVYCLNLKSKDCSDLVVGTQPLAQGREENICDDVLQKYLQDTKARVVRDSEWDASWYLRDRSCIEDIEATPGAVLDILAASNWDQHSRKSTFAAPANWYGSSSFAMLVGALTDSPAAPKDLLSRIRERAAGSDITFNGEVPHPVKNRLWIREAVPALIDSYSRCQKAGKLAEFAEPARRFEESLHDKRVSGPSPFGPSASELIRHEYLEGKIQDLTKALSAACR